MKLDRPIASILILFIILVLVYFLVWPEYKTFTNLRYELGEKTAQYNAEKDYYAEITKEYYELQNRSNDLKKMDDALPQGPNFGKLIYYFQKTATEDGVLLRNLFLSKTNLYSTSGTSENTQTMNELILTMDIIGNYSSLEKFLSSLEKSDRIFEVTNITFNSGGGIAASPISQNKSASQFQSQGTYTFNLQVKTHSY